MTDRKAVLRREMQRARADCADRALRDVRILERILLLPAYQKTDTLLCYVSMRSETGTHMLIRQALRDGKAVYVPRCLEEPRKMAFYRIFSFAELHPGTMGILEPEASDETASDETLWRGGQSLCFIPGLAFGKNGARLGYGGGYYDAFLWENGVEKIGICYDFQLLPEIWEEDHDIRMDSILTDERLLICGLTRSEKGERMGRYER